MTERNKKRKRNNKPKPSLTVADRSIIGANWQTFQSSNLIMDEKVEKPAQTNPPVIFRRNRKKKNPENDEVHTTPLHNLQITNNNNKIEEKQVSNNQDTGNNKKKITIFSQTFRSSNLKKVEIPAQTNPPVNIRRNRRKKKPNNDTVNTTPLNNDSTNNNRKIEEKQVSANQNIGDYKKKLTKFIAIDCEMVGSGYNGNDSMLARVSIVNKFGVCVYDKFVKPREEVTDYRTQISGIRKEDIENGEDFSIVQKEVAEIIKGKVLVGHSLKHDLNVLYLSHASRQIRDTSKYKPFRKITKGSTPSLKRLSKEILNIDIQSGEHSSVEDARAVMQVYNTVAKTWENSLSGKRGYFKTSY